MNTARIAAATAAAGLILAAGATHADASLIKGSVWDTKGASIRVWTGSTSHIIYQGQHANGATSFRLRYDRRCVYVNTGNTYSSHYYKADPGITHPTRGFGIQAFAWSKCPSSAKWISAVL